MHNYDFIVIGAGSGGIAAANRAAENGAKVAIIEKNLLGGTCVNVGCVPKKIMWLASQRAAQINHAPEFGFVPCNPSIHWKTLVQRRQAYIERLHGLYKNKLQKNGITLIHGEARFKNDHSVTVANQDYHAPHILIATGSHATWPSLPGQEYGIDSDGFFALQEKPERVAVVGAGYIAVELAGVLKGLGCNVSLAFRHKHFLRSFDYDVTKRLATLYQQQGIKLWPQHTPSALEQNDKGLVLVCENNKKLPPVDVLIWAIGRNANTKKLGLENTKVTRDSSGQIQVDAYQNTSVAGIYAIGDVASHWQLTPVAIKAGRILATRLFGKKSLYKMDYCHIPTVIFSHPPIATVGLSEKEARNQFGVDITLYESTFNPMSQAFSDMKEPCYIKLITQTSSDKILGCHMIGEAVDEILQGFAVAIKMGATKADLDDTVAIHPTIAEELVTLR